MILVIGSVIVDEGKFAHALALSLEHVSRSRAEPGCVSHAVHQDAENPNRLVFVEEWLDQDALQQHFRVPASRAFAKAVGQLAALPPSLSVYCATQLPTHPRMSDFVFETARLQARRIQPTDVEAMLGVYGDREVVRWVGDGQPLDRALCEKWVAITHNNYASRGYGMFALLARESGAVLGFAGLVHPDGQAEAEIKYALHRSHWGQGLATEAVSALLAYGATQHGLAEVIATTAPENEASHRVLLKAGMRRAALRENDDGTFTQLFIWRSSLAP